MLFLTLSIIFSPVILVGNIIAGLIGFIVFGGINILGIAFNYKEWRNSWGDWERNQIPVKVE